MRIYLLPILLLSVWIPGTGQQTAGRSAKAMKERSIPAAAFTLFQVAMENQRSPDWPKMSEYEIFEPLTAQIQQLYNAAPDSLNLVIPRRNAPAFHLQLVRVQILTGDFAVELSRGEQLGKSDTGIFYRGHLRGREASVVAISLFPDELSGFWSDGEEGANWVLGRLPDGGPHQKYLLYLDAGLVFSPGFTCAMPDGGAPYQKQDLLPAPRNKQKSLPCIDLFLEIDYDVFRDKGGAEKTVRYVTSLFNQVAAVFAQDDIVVQLARLYIWNVPSIYNGVTAERQLAQFQAHRTSWEGHLAQLLSYKVNGGISAGFEGLCSEDRAASMSYAGIQSSFSSLPNYSWTVNVVAHELGHLLGARHTHACVWNGDGTSIDDCGNVYMQQRRQEPEGSTCFVADRPRYPEGGGTLMSYCHLLQGIGINLAKGFHEQPLVVIRSKMAQSACLDSCVPGPLSTECVGNEITLSLTLDDFGSETTWTLSDQNGLIIYEGGPYVDGHGGELFEQKLCLGPGCFSLEIQDAYGDGMCCYYGEGEYTLTDTSGAVIARGAQFDDREIIEFCLPLDGQAPALRDDCQLINFHEFPPKAYGGDQDRGEFEISAEGTVIRLWGNAWKAIALDYEVSPYTILEFDFGSTAKAEVHAIGLDTDDKPAANQTFKLFGTQNWGILQYFHYQYTGEWMSFAIPVGLYYRGTIRRMFFCVDDDDAPVNGDSWFRNIRLYESGDCGAGLAGGANRRLQNVDDQLSAHIFPNPAHSEINITLSTSSDEAITVQLMNMVGQVLKCKSVLPLARESRESLWVGDLPAGAYFLRLETGTKALVQKVIIAGSRE